MFLPDNIDFTESNKYILSIRLLPSGFYFSIHSPYYKTVFYQNSVTFKPNSDYLNNIERLIFDFAFFSNNFKKINVICIDDKATIIPSRYYDKRLEKDILSYNCLYPKSHIISNDIKDLNSKVIWSMNESIHHFLSRTLLNPKFVSHLSLLTPFFYRKHNHTNSALFINFNNENIMDVIAFSNEKLILAKTFRSNNTLEECYFIQKVWEELELDVQSDILFFSGKISKHAECIEMLKKLISKTKILPIKLSINTKENLEEIPTEILYQL